jgi:hypothetical protein
MREHTKQLYAGNPPAWAITVALLPMIASWVAMALALPNGRLRYGLLLAAGLALALGYGLTALMAQRYPDERKG